MWSNKSACFGGLLLLALTANAQTTPGDSASKLRGPYAIVLLVGGGSAYYPKYIGVPPDVEQVNIDRFGIPLTARLMWYPDHRLRIGLESGWTPMYSYRVTASGQRARVAVSAVPMLLVFSMPLAWLSGTERSLARRLAVTGGTGAYLVRSSLNYAGEVNTSKLSIGWMAAGSYTQPISRRLRIAAELKWYEVTATDDAVFSAQLQLVWRAFSW